MADQEAAAAVANGNTGELSLEEMNAFLTENSFHLRQVGFPAAIFVVEAIRENNFTYRTFAGKVRFAENLRETGLLGRSIAIGTNAGVFDIHTLCTIKEFSRWVDHLKSKDGAAKLRRAQHKAKTMKKVKEIREKGEEEVKLLEAAVAIRRKKLEDDLASAEARYWPVTSFRPPPKEELAEKAWELYEADCLSRCAAVRPKKQGGIETALALYGQAALQSFEMRHACNPIHRDAFIQYLKEKLHGFRAVANHRQASITENLLVNICGKEGVVFPNTQ